MNRVSRPFETVFGILLLVVAADEPARAEQHGQDGFAFIQGGSFVMGTDAADIPELKKSYDVDFDGVFENESPARKITLSDFRLDQYEVTNALFAEFVSVNPAWGKSALAAGLQNGDYLNHWRAGRYPEDRALHPVVNVTWAAAQSYCRWRGGRLPTEAEWEFAARAGDSREFPWGDAAPSALRANYSASGNGTTVEVGSYEPNAFGIYDVAGNVWEFLYDEWSEQPTDEPQSDPVSGGPLADDRISAVTGRRSVRGASYDGSVVNIRTRWRDSHVVSNAIEFVGFRCAYPE